MQVALVLDRYTNKYLNIGDIPTDIFANLKIGDKLVYTTPDPKSGVLKYSVGVLINFKEKASENYQTAQFARLLEGDEYKEFEEQQTLAIKIFPTFKKDFKAEFPNSTPITARFQTFSDQLFFFFFSEERYVFTEFVKKFREKLGMNIFLFQVGAREMIKMSPGTDGMYGSCGNLLCCKSNRNLLNVDIDAVVLQHLEGRDIEKLKGKCGKLKCCLLYELSLYIDESKQYPRKGSKINMCKITDHCKDTNCQAEECQGFVVSFNIVTQEVNIKTKEGFFRIPLEKLKALKTV
ncbi:hypothetical protein AGMMS50249_1820 [candidate division SR1 bacterium]|nr:hypothetical protein AGMMS50249_1820 [candidate division SR1 bacterium]